MAHSTNLFEILVEEWLTLLEDSFFSTRLRGTTTPETLFGGPAVLHHSPMTSFSFDFSLTSQIMVQIANYVTVCLHAPNSPALSLVVEVDPMEIAAASPLLGSLLLRPLASARSTISATLDSPVSHHLPPSLTSLDALSKSVAEAARRWLESQTAHLQDYYSLPSAAAPQDPVTQFIFSGGYGHVKWADVLVRPSYAPETLSALLDVPPLAFPAAPPISHPFQSHHARLGVWSERNVTVSHIEYAVSVKGAAVPPAAPSSDAALYPTGKAIVWESSTMEGFHADFHRVRPFAVSVSRKGYTGESAEVGVGGVAPSPICSRTHPCLVVGGAMLALCLEVPQMDLQSERVRGSRSPVSSQSTLCIYSVSSRPVDNLSTLDLIEQAVSCNGGTAGVVSTYDCWSQWRLRQWTIYHHSLCGASPAAGPLVPTMDDYFVAARATWLGFATGAGSICPSPTNMGAMVGILLCLVSSRLQERDNASTHRPNSSVSSASACRPLSVAVVGHSLPLEQLLCHVLEGVADVVEGPSVSFAATPTALVPLPRRAVGNPLPAPATPATFWIEGGCLSQGPVSLVHPLSEHMSCFPLQLALHFTHSLSKRLPVAGMDMGQLLAPLLKQLSTNIRSTPFREGRKGWPHQGTAPNRPQFSAIGGGPTNKKLPSSTSTSSRLPPELEMLQSFLRSKGLITPTGNPTNEMARTSTHDALTIPYCRAHSAVYLCAIDSGKPPFSVQSIVRAPRSIGPPKDVPSLLAHCDLILPVADLFVVSEAPSDRDRLIGRGLDRFLSETGVRGPKEFSPDAYILLQLYYRALRQEAALGVDAMALLVRLATAHSLLVREQQVLRPEGIVITPLLHDTIDAVDVIVAIALCDVQCHTRSGCSVLTFPFFAEGLKPEFSFTEFLRDITVYLQHQCNGGRGE